MGGKDSVFAPALAMEFIQQQWLGSPPDGAPSEMSAASFWSNILPKIFRRRADTPKVCAWPILNNDVQLRIVSLLSNKDKVNFALACRSFRWVLLQDEVCCFVSGAPGNLDAFPNAVERADISAEMAGAAALQPPQQVDDREPGGNEDVDSAMPGRGHALGTAKAKGGLKMLEIHPPAAKPNVRQLTVEVLPPAANPNVTQLSVENHPSAAKPNVRQLTVRRKQGLGVTLGMLPTLPLSLGAHLQVLDVHHCRVAAGNLSHLSILSRLELRQCTIEAVDRAQCFPLFSAGHQKLRSVGLHDCVFHIPIKGVRIIMINLPSLQHIHICGTAAEIGGWGNYKYFEDISFQWKDAVLPQNLQTMAIESVARPHVFDSDGDYLRKYSFFRWASLTRCTGCGTRGSVRGETYAPRGFGMRPSFPSADSGCKRLMYAAASQPKVCHKCPGGSCQR